MTGINRKIYDWYKQINSDWYKQSCQVCDQAINNQ